MRQIPMGNKNLIFGVKIVTNLVFCRYFSLSMGTMEEDVHMFLGADLERSDRDYEEIIEENPVDYL